MECESTLFVKNYVPYLWDNPKSFSNSFIDFYSCEIVSGGDNLRKNEVLSFDRFVSIMAVVFKLWIYFMLLVAKSYHDAKQKTKKKLSRVGSTDWKSALNCKTSTVGDWLWKSHTLK